MPDLLVATPLRSFPENQSHTFHNDISVREINSIKWDVSVARQSLSPQALSNLKNTRHWLCASASVEQLSRKVQDDLYARAEDAMAAYQVICPSGADNIFLEFIRDDDGYDCVGTYHPKALSGTRVRCTWLAEHQGLADHFDAVFEMVVRASQKKTVRLLNAIRLLEHGMQVTEVHLGALMFAMALDMLTMAAGKSHFIPRLGGFLGPQTFVFPPESTLGQQPSVRVGDILKDFFSLRNIIAHGQRIPSKPYGQKYVFQSVAGWQLDSEDYYYGELMFDCGMFLVSSALRKIAIEGLIDQVGNDKEWRGLLQLGVTRWEPDA